MKLEQISPDRYEFSDVDRRFTRYLRYFLIVIALIGTLNAIFTGSFGPVIVVLVVGTGFWKLASHVDVDTRAIFDRSTGEFQFRQTRRGRLVEERAERLGTIENVVIEANRRHKANDNSVLTRPAIVVQGQSIPLTYASFLGGSMATDTARTLRRFLNLPDTDLIDDSVRQALKGPAGTGPAVRLARIGKGLGRLDAAAYIKSMEEQADLKEKPRTPTHSISREQS